MFWLLFLLFLALLLVYLYTFGSLNYWSLRDVPSETPLPIFGNLLNIALGKDHFWSMMIRMYNKFDDGHPYFGIYVSHKPILVIKDRDLIKKILIKDFNFFVNRTNHENERVDALVTNTLFVLKNNFWRNIRKKVSPIMTTGRMKELLPFMVQIAGNMENTIEKNNNENIDVRDLFKKFAIDFSGTCFFGMQCETLKNKNHDLWTIIEEMFDQRLIYRRIATFGWVLLPFLVDVFRLSFFDLKITRSLMDIYFQAEEEREIGYVKRNDLMGLMMDISKEETSHPRLKFDPVKRVAQALQLLTTGTEALAYATSTCLYDLALNPVIQEKLRSEIRQNLDSDGNISYQALAKMEYLDSVTKESLRMHPFLPFLTRFAEEDYTFESTGLKLEKGTQILIPTVALHGDPKYYPEPSNFNPERYRGDKMKDLQYVYLPFGEGPRKCVGDRLSQMAIKVAIISILKKYKVSLGETTEVPLKLAKNAMFITTEDGSVWLNLESVDYNTG